MVEEALDHLDPDPASPRDGPRTVALLRQFRPRLRRNVALSRLMGTLEVVEFDGSLNVGRMGSARVSDQADDVG
jgi:hypothetical protein